MTTAAIYLYNENQTNVRHRSKDHMTTQTADQQLDAFLREHQQQAYAIAVVGVQQQADALDVVQETMLAFVKYYRDKPIKDWRPLFYRVLQNKINDHHRKQKGWMRYFFSSKDKDQLAEEQASHEPSPLDCVDLQNQGNEMVAIIQKLPSQQQQVVLYRHWQELSVEETAQIMQISTGSVKTHLYRATQKIKSLLGVDHE
ncbi:MAG: sigma-70 family RNA polymerase sigma factor [Xanthomonadales bacterium]|nr:sigma-70 family RNA polymerase sigma factor [Xanthomonadales bacterium]